MSAVKEIALRVKDEIKRDNVVVNAAGLAFFGLLALVPTMLAFVSIYGLARDPSEVEEQVSDLLESAPAEIREFVSFQLESLADSSSGSLGFTVVISILIALWGASGAVKHLMATLNDINEYEETRGFLALRGTAYFFTLGALVVLSITIFLLGVMPGVLASTELGSTGRIWAGILRFPVLLLLMAVSLSILYHLGPDRPHDRRFRLLTVGAACATVAWLVGSGIFSIYTANIGRLNETYAAMGGIVILLLFLFLTSFCVLLGAEIDSVREHRALRAEDGVDQRTASGRSRTDGRRDTAALGSALVGVAVGVALGRRP